MSLGPMPMPPQGPQGPASPSPVPAPADLMSQHQALVAKREKLDTAAKLLGKVRGQMDSLVALADTITQDDVVKAASELVAAGLDPAAMAGMLADMPENKEALQAWVAEHDQEVQQREAQLAQVAGQVRHQAGATGLRLLMHQAGADSMGQEGPLAAPPADESAGPAGANALMGVPSDAD